MSNTILTILKKADKYRVEIKKDSRGNIGSNANTWVSVYLNDEKYPYVRTLRTDSTPLSELIGWAEIQIQQHIKH